MSGQPHEIIYLHEILSKAQTVNGQRTLSILKDALENNRFEMFAQSIVSLPSRNIKFFECYTRVRDEAGQLLSPHIFLEEAKKEGCINIIDNLVLFECVRLALRIFYKRHDIKLFCNISPESLQNDLFLSTFQNLILENPVLTPKIVIEIDNEVILKNENNFVQTIEKLAKKQCHFSIDNSKIHNVDFDFMDRLHCKYIKLTKSLLLEEMKSNNGDLSSIQTFKEQAAKRGISLIITFIESDVEIEMLQPLGFELFQGYHFSKPRNIQKIL